MTEFVIGLVVGGISSAIVTGWYFSNFIREQARRVRDLCEDMEKRKGEK